MKSLFYFCMAISVMLACTELQSQKSMEKSPGYALAIHGGAGTILKENMTTEKEKAYVEILQKALDVGEAILKSGGSSANAVEATVQVMENSELFNAGKGAVYTHEGMHELDASFMDGKSGNAGAVAGVKTIKNPIRLARIVMDSSVHVLLSGAGADEFGKEMGLDLVENSYFDSEFRRMQLEKVQGKTQAFLDHDIKDEKFGTVGAVALDKDGNLAAATSTGGMTNKRYGRIGDSPITGAGTYANNATCAVSCTGHGEYFIRNVVAYDVSARMEYLNESLEEASNFIVNEKLANQNASGGLIAVDKNGNVSLPFNSAGMYRGFVKENGDAGVFIYKENTSLSN